MRPTRKRLLRKLDELENEVMTALRDKVLKSKKESKHMDTKVMPVNIFHYTELAIINDRLTFMDNSGYQYSIDNGDCTLLDLIELL